MDRLDVFSLYSPELNKQKTIRVYLTESMLSSKSRHPVLYMHDGQNLFDDATASFGVSWHVKEALRETIHEGVMPWIVVGIDSESEDRWDEYAPYPCDAFAMSVKQKKIPEGGKATAYVDFLVQTLKPWIDEQYPTLPDETAIAGSSMGGLVSVYGAIRHPSVFRQVGAFSPAWWFHAESSREMLEAAAFPLPIRIYQDMGTSETSQSSIASFPTIYLEGARNAAWILEAKSNVDFLYLEVQNGEHNEAAWAKRFPDFLRWLQ